MKHKTCSAVYNALLLTACCLLVGCTQAHQQRASGFPVRVGVQGETPLPVHLKSDPNNTVMVEFKPSELTLPVKLQVGHDEPLPVALLLENGQVLPVEIKAEPNKPLSVELQNKSLTVELDIRQPLPVSINISPNILILAVILIIAVIAVCVAVTRLCCRK